MQQPGGADAMSDGLRSRAARRLQSVADWCYVAMALLGAAVVWSIVFGFLAVLPLSDEYESCFVSRNQHDDWNGSAEFLGAHETVVPFSVVCRWGDGYTEQLVADWLNPTVAVIAGLFGAALVTALISSAASRRAG
ncbi:hypothetical protein [Jiangella asiatica]|uniref:Uncharacterized protein n=1 Tax=Jiangella asiatica TaxID=2530372 RepID=A0A4R5CMM0_9ACTN|nr:hypothetical protein [Jiangella asiatica]TDE00480.1 hypothetical protein E1269_25245 [Jiangella asiatica]